MKDHDQKTHGNRGGALTTKVEREGGFTYNPVRLKFRKAPENGFALSIEKGAEEVVEPDERAKLKAKIIKYVRNHWDRIKRHYLYAV